MHLSSLTVPKGRSARVGGLSHCNQVLQRLARACPSPAPGRSLLLVTPATQIPGTQGSQTLTAARIPSKATDRWLPFAPVAGLHMRDLGHRASAANLAKRLPSSNGSLRTCMALGQGRGQRDELNWFLSNNREQIAKTYPSYADRHGHQICCHDFPHMARPD